MYFPFEQDVKTGSIRRLDAASGAPTAVY